MPKIEKLEKTAMRLEREFERAPSLFLHKKLNDLWKEINKLYLASLKV